MAITITVNGQARSVDVDADTPLLWALRDTLGLTGTKFGCGIAECGACTVLVDGRAERSCMFPAANAEGASVTTIEGLAPKGSLHPVQQAWVAHQVPQCGYCQSGMIMAACPGFTDQSHPTHHEKMAQRPQILLLPNAPPPGRPDSAGRANQTAH